MANSTSDDIAIIGMACRYPGEARSVDGFLSMLEHGRDAWSKIPKERFNVDAYYHPSQERQGNIVAQGGYFLKDQIDTFDSPFFSMTAAEANALDPQQRLLLESTFECLESAGIPMHKMVGSQTSVMIGCFTRDYENISGRHLHDSLLYQAIGQGLAMMSNRLSWFYDLKGESLTLDTACSSSLVALHLACQSIRAGESKMSIVGGVGLILLPDIMRHLTSLHFLSPDSKCYSFDERANGYARGEGIGTLILKPVADALRDGDCIRAVIRGTGSNQDGRTPGVTLPSAEAQARLIADTYRQAGLSIKDTGYFEAHGTGTPAGDPIELEALSNVLRLSPEPRQPLYVGSVKTNIGHLEGCAGVAGVMKAVLSLETGLIFPNLNFEKPNPRLHLDEWNIRIPTRLIPWPSSGARRISINSFGYGGSNAHCIVDDAYHYLEERGLQGFTNTRKDVPELAPSTETGLDCVDSGIGSDASSSDGASELVSKHEIQHDKKLFVLSARDEQSLDRLKTAYSKWLSGCGNSAAFLDSFAHTLASRRSLFVWRQAVVASNCKALSTAMLESKALRSRKQPRIAFIFTGQGAQYHNMGRGLMCHQAYADCVRRADSYLNSLGSSWSIIEAMHASEAASHVDEPEFSQPLCTVMQVALVDLLTHWGVAASTVAGHSSGEIAAAYAAGALSAEDAWKIAYHRGQVTKRIAEVRPGLNGGMLAVGLSESKSKTYLGSSIVIACINSPTSVTLSGDVDALDEVHKKLQAEGIFSRKLKVTNAYHSPHMDCVAEEYKTAIADIQPREVHDGCTFYSSVLGTFTTGTTLNAEYWVNNMTSPVKFLHAVDAMFPDKKVRRRRDRAAVVNTFIEIGPSGALQGPLRDIVSSKDNKDEISLLAMLSRGKDAVETALTLAGKLWTMGHTEIDLDRVNNQTLSSVKPAIIVDTPTYPWNHASRYWHEAQQSYNHRHPRTGRLDVLGIASNEWNPSEPTWHNKLRISELPWLREHQVLGSIIFPAAGYLCAVIEAARQVADQTKITKSFELRDIVIGRALELTDDTDVVELVTSLRPRKLGLRGNEAPWTEFTIYSNSDKGHIEHCSGLLYTHYEHTASELENGQEEKLRRQKLATLYRDSMSRSATLMPARDFYDIFDDIGLQYGPLFQGISAVRTGHPGVGCTEVTITDTKAAMPQQFEYEHLLHPCTLDACFQSIFTAFLSQKARLRAMVPTLIEKVKIAATQPSKYFGHASGDRRGFRGAIGNIVMSDEDFTTPFIEIEGFACTELGALTGGQAVEANGDNSLRKVQSYWRWRPDPFMFTEDTAAQEIMMSSEEFASKQHFWVHLTTEFEKLAAIFGKRALRNLTPEIEKKLPSYLKLFVDWLRSQDELAHRGELPLQRGSTAWMAMTFEEEETFINQYQHEPIDSKMIIAVGRELDNIFNGSTMALSVLMKDNMLFEYFSHSLGMGVATDQWERFFDLYGHKNPSMQILEVGAGSGSITEPILQALSGSDGSSLRCSSYVFTDISTGFFEPAEQKLKQWSNVLTFKRFDLEADPLDQDFELESFDVITATNVLHATKNIDNTLQNCLKLLKPGGHLLLGEITSPHARLSMIYGTLPGWWLSEDGRNGGPLMGESQWLAAFERNGLSIDYLVRDLPDEDIHLMTFFVATKPANISLPYDRILLVADEHPSPELQALVTNLAKSLQAEQCSLNDITTTAGKDDSLARTAIISVLEVEKPLLMSLDGPKLEALQHMLTKTAISLWLTRGDRLAESDPSYRLIDGLTRSLRNEDASLRLHVLDFEKTMKLESDDAWQSITKHFQRVCSVDKDTAETEAAYQNKRFFIPRLYDDCPKNFDLQMLHKPRPPVPQPLKQPGRPLYMTIKVPSMLDTLHWADDEDLLVQIHPEEVRIRVEAGALNFHDIMVAMGIVPDRDGLGADAAGVVIAVGSAVTKLKLGDRVACQTFGAFRSIVRCPECLPQKIPDAMSFNDAATILTIYVTAYQALIEIGRLQKGETILIHVAAGGLGQAAIQVAQYIGAEIFVTVGSMAKKKLIMELYNIADDHIFNSRDYTFADGVLRATDGKGVDVVLNSLAGEALRKTWTCMKDLGRFLEVGKRDVLGNNGLEMMPFLRNVTFAGVNIEHLVRHATQKAADVAAKVMKLVHEGKIGVVKPVTVYSMADAEKAFRTMQQGKHTGKIVLSMDDCHVPVIPRDEHPLHLREDRTYLLVGGLGGVGRAQAIWLANNGAKFMAFISRSGAASDAAKQTMGKLAKLNVTAKAYACDVADAKALAQTLAVMDKELPQISGVMQGAMVLSDSLFANMKIDDWMAAFRPKVLGSWNLHELLPKDLDFFIMLSSLAGVVGSRGQANYAAGNTFQQGLAWYRHNLGMPATVLDLSIMGGFGFVKENLGDTAVNNVAEQVKFVTVEPDELFSLLKSSITGYTDGLARMPVQATIGAGTGGMLHSSDLEDKATFYWHDDIKFAYLKHLDTINSNAGAAGGDSEFRAAISSATTLVEATELIQQAVTRKLAKAMMMAVEDIDVGQPVSAYGVDSLVAVEVRNWLARELKCDVSVFDILSPVPIKQLVQKLALKSALVPSELKTDVEGTAEDSSVAIAASETIVPKDDLPFAIASDEDVPTATVSGS